MRHLRRNDALAAEMVKASLGQPVVPPFVGLVAIDDEGAPVSAVILNNYERRDVHVTVVNAGNFGVRAMRHLAWLIFVNLGCARVTAITRADNLPAQRGLLQLGFRQEGIMREHFDGADGLLFGLLRSEQKIVRLK